MATRRQVHLVRLTTGLLAWGLLVMDLTTNLVRDVTEHINHPLAPAAVPVVLLLIVTTLVWVRKPVGAALDLAVGLVAPVLVLFWHLPRWLYRSDNAAPLLFYASFLFSLGSHARSLFTFFVLFILGVTTLLSPDPSLAFSGGVIFACSAMFAAWRVGTRVLDPDRLIGVPVKHGHRVLDSKTVQDVFAKADPKSAEKESQWVGLVLAALGVILDRLSLNVLKRVRRQEHVVLIIGHILVTYFFVLLGFAGLQLGVYLLWPGAYVVSVTPTFWRFFAHTILSTFNVPGSGIVSAAIGPGLLQVLAVVLLGSTSIAGAVGLVRTLRGRYEDRAKKAVKELQAGLSKFEREFSKRFGQPMRVYLEGLRDSSGQFTEFVLSVVGLVDAMGGASATGIPRNRRARRSRSGRRR